MTDGVSQNMSKTRKGDREIISVSLPLHIYDAMQELCDHYNMNRSSMISKAIVSYLSDFGIKVGEH